MLPSWRNRLCVVVGPDRLGLLKLGRGLKPKLLRSHEEGIANSGSQPPWRLGIERLGKLLAESEWHNDEVEIVLSNRLVHYATITFDARLRKFAEREAFAKHLLTRTYGSTAAQWDLRSQKNREAMPSLVSAVERPLLEGLRQVCSDQKIDLRSISPHLMVVINKYRSAITADPAWLVISEPGYSLFVLLSRGGVVTINGVSHNNLDELPLLLDRENLVSAFPEPCRVVYVYGAPESDLPSLTASGYDFVGLERTVTANMMRSTECSYALALSGVL